MVVDAASAFERKRLERMMELLLTHPEQVDNPSTTYDMLEESGLFDHAQLKQALLASIRETRRRRKESGDDAGAKRLDGIISVMELLLGEKDFEQAMKDMDHSIQALKWNKQEPGRDT